MTSNVDYGMSKIEEDKAKNDNSMPEINLFGNKRESSIKLKTSAKKK
eukprot:CAMPEP_0205817446 /NCGR_PEP_ID=MMETSP0205-20121125/24349_1 /ASSEMBLY_ACC=CAM_ASM_000278 /TAXON_ID=36767 /ORGANISM="Euplotes focardii, Strain TN1" /LENGTH=46 /DNA_ID= /DNA_START= /DNA_END= /DNA_ORIENTATION=